MEREVSAERRPALTAPARAGLRNVRVGAKKRDSEIAVGTVLLTAPRADPDGPN